MKETLRKLLGPKLYAFGARQFVTRRIKRAVRFTKNPAQNFTAENSLDFLFSEAAKNVSPWQIRDELLELAKLIEKKKPQVVLEIGTASGGTLFLAACLAAPDALIISLDLPHGLFGGGYPDWKVPLYRAFAQKNQTIEILRGDSHSEEMLQQLKAILQGRKIDYLFIDGDHTYEGVKQDFEKYSPLLNRGAMIAFHDIVSDKSPQPDHFVSIFWDEIKGRYKHREFIKDRNQSKLGLGVLELD